MRVPLLSFAFLLFLVSVFSAVQLGRVSGASSWMFRQSVGCVNKVLDAVALCWVAMWFGLRARKPFSFVARAVGLVFGLRYNFGPSLGGLLFGSLHFTLFWAIWVLVPLLTADCISRERREGTLGLLFLTRLRATDIVFAKTLAQALRALTLWLAVL